MSYWRMRWRINYLHQCCREYRRRQKHYLFLQSIFWHEEMTTCLMLTIYKLYLTPRPVTKLIKMYRSRLYQKRPTWLVYLRTSSLSNRYQSEKKFCILLARLGKLTEDGNSLPVLAPCNLSSLFFNNYKHKRSVFNVKPRETRYLSV